MSEEVTKAASLVEKCFNQLLSLQNLKRAGHRRKALDLLKEHLEDYNALLSLNLDFHSLQLLRQKYPTAIEWVGFTPLCQSKEDRDRNQVAELLFDSLLKNSSKVG